MVTRYIKQGQHLTEDELAQMEALMHTSRMDENFIRRHHIEKMPVTFYLYKVEEQIMAYQAVSWHQAQTPFSRQPIEVLYINLAYKHPHAPATLRDFVQRTNYHTVRQRLGRFWMLRRFVVTFTTVNPKGIGRIQRIFGQYYPQYQQPTPTEVHQFAQNFVKKHLKRETTVSLALAVKTSSLGDPLDVTDNWDSHYKASQPEWNDFFIKNGVFEVEKGRYTLTAKRLVLFIDLYTWTGALRRWITGRD